jgi:hypothetical protein
VDGDQPANSIAMVVGVKKKPKNTGLFEILSLSGPFASVANGSKEPKKGDPAYGNSMQGGIHRAGGVACAKRVLAPGDWVWQNFTSLL